MSSKRISTILVLLFLLPWGVQCLIDNFISIYVASLPFATEQTVGTVGALGSVVTMVSQLLWTRWADRAKDKCNVLALSFVMMAAVSILFLLLDIQSEWLLLALVILFYFCYLTHQPLIDTIASQTYDKTNHSFGWFRSFASFGYGVMGLLFVVLPHGNANSFFLYVLLLAVASGIVSKCLHARHTLPPTPASSDGSPAASPEQKKGLFPAKFVKYLIFSFFLFLCSAIINAFFGVYFSTEKGINSDVGLFSFFIGAGTFLEWGIMMIFGKKIAALSPKAAFGLIAVAGVFRSGIIFLTKNPYLMGGLSVFFSAIWFSTLWSVSTPYMKKILPAEKLASAQGIWTVVTFGVARFVGSLLGAQLVAWIGLRELFLVPSAILALLGLATPFLF